jgi:GDP-L-fucose synthase
MNSSMQLDSRIYIAGHRGLVGSAIIRRLKEGGHNNLITLSHSELDLTSQEAVREFFAREKPEYVFLAAAKVGGIYANNTYPADFIYQNLVIQTNVIHSAYLAGVKRLLFLGSSCIYPRDCPQPIKEEYLLTGPLESTNRPYAIAKIAGIEMCWSYNRQYGTQYLAVMPTNLFGPGDNYDLNKSHVIPALIRKFHLAKLAMAGDWAAIERDEAAYGAIPEDVLRTLKEGGRSVILWGDGSPYREFMYSDDMALACVQLLQLKNEKISELTASTTQPPLVNVGTGEDLTINNLAQLIAKVVVYHGDVVWDKTKPNGTPKKQLDVSKMSALVGQHASSLSDGLNSTYRFYCENRGR